MFSSSSLSKHLVLFQLLAIQFILIRSVSSLNLTNSYLIHKCGVGAKVYKSRSKYEKNLNTEIRSHMTFGTSQQGYNDVTYKRPPNTVTIVLWCRGDSYGMRCRSCYETAVAGLRRRCKKDIVGDIWYDQCFLSFGGERVIDENRFSLHNPKNLSGDINAFNKKLVDLLNKLTLESIRVKKDDIPINYAGGEMKFGAHKVYAMVQCMQIISEDFCKECLESNIKKILTCCGGKQGAMVLNSLCNVRYELYPFLSSYKPV